MSRLTEKNVIAVCGHCNSWDICKPDDTCFVKDVYKKLAHYEDLEEQGRLIELPCKVGSTTWCIDRFNSDGTLRKQPTVREIKFNHHHLEFVDKSIFLTKEEAEEALKRLQGNE